MKSVVHGLTLAAVAGVLLGTGCEKSAPSEQNAKAPVKAEPMPQTPATTEPPAPKAEAPAPAPANPIGEPAVTPPPPKTDSSNLPPTLGTATLKDGVMTVAGVNMTIPEGWEVEDVGTAAIRPAMKFKLAAPAGTSIEPGVVNVFSGIKGTPEQNITRWMAQVNQLETREKDQYEQNGLTITRAQVVGQYNPGFGMTGGSGPKADWALYGVVISGGPEGDVHIIARGPKQVVLRQREQWDAFVKSAVLATGTPSPATEAPAEEAPTSDAPKAGG